MEVNIGGHVAVRIDLDHDNGFVLGCGHEIKVLLCLLWVRRSGGDADGMGEGRGGIYNVMQMKMKRDQVVDKSVERYEQVPDVKVREEGERKKGRKKGKKRGD